MKTLLKSVKTLTFVLAASLSFAGIAPEISVVDAGQKSFVLYLDDARAQTVAVQITDAQGTILLEDRVKHPRAFARKYNLSNLPAGEYNVLIENGVQILVQPITLGTTVVQVHEDKTTTLFQPTLRKLADKLDMTLLCVDASQVAIRIIDASGNVNYSASGMEVGSVQRRFDISALDSGYYTMATTVKCGNVEKTWRNVFTVRA